MIKNAVQLLTASLIVLGLCCKKEDQTDPGDTRMNQGCTLQYIAEKWINKGDSVVLPICPKDSLPAGKLDSISVTYKQTNDGGCAECWELRLMNRQSNINYDMWPDSGMQLISNWVSTMKFKVLKFERDTNVDRIRIAFYYNVRIRL